MGMEKAKLNGEKIICDAFCYGSLPEYIHRMVRWQGQTKQWGVVMLEGSGYHGNTSLIVISIRLKQIRTLAVHLIFIFKLYLLY